MIDDPQGSRSHQIIDVTRTREMSVGTNGVVVVIGIGIGTESESESGMVVVTGTMIRIGIEEDRMIVKLVNVVHEDDVIYHLNLWIQIAAVLKLEITSPVSKMPSILLIYPVLSSFNSNAPSEA